MKAIMIAAVLILWALNGLAGGPAGHMIVAALAWSKLTPEARQEAARLLKENPYYDRWTQDVADADKDEGGVHHRGHLAGLNQRRQQL